MPWKLLLLSCLVISSATLYAARPETYARPELLVEVSAVTAAPVPLVVLDSRPLADYQQSHIPGAVHVDAAAWKAAFGEGTDTAGWSKRIGALGIDGKSPVVVYGAKLDNEAARMWWILRYWGVDGRLLNGGWQAWQASELPTTDDVPATTCAEFAAQAHPERLVTYDAMRMLVDAEHATQNVVDTRTKDEFRAGYIPGSCHLDWQELIDANTGKLRSPTEVSALLDRVAFDASQPQVAYCQSGGRASVMAFAMELMGAEHVANYYGSWGEWSKHRDAPVARPTSGTGGE